MKTKKIAIYGVLIALAFIFSYIETLIPMPTSGIAPGIKIGLANMVVMVALYKMGNKEAFTLSIIRVILFSFVFGNLFSLLYSLSGGILSCIFMIMAKKTNRLSSIGVSVIGGVVHNIGQILMAMIIVESTKIIFYLPILLISGVISGVTIGIIASIIIKHTKKITI
ncbi:MAG TPA: Gx transporter family protein [Clostridiales bacterium]|nr:Gx transporter family protein [Clostridiales bacterium]